MKIFSLRVAVVSLCLFVAAIEAQIDPTSKTYNLRGSVKTVETYWLVPQENDGKDVKQQISAQLLFNRKGQLTESISYATEEMPTRELHIYNKTGQEVVGEYYGGLYRKDLNSPWESSEEYVYKYNRAGMISEQSELDRESKSLVKRTALRYDGRGNVIESLLYYAGDKTASERNIYTYDRLNRRTAWSKFDRNGSLKSKTTSAFNAAGLVSEETFAGEEYRSRVKISYTYDQKQRLLVRESINLDKNKELERTVYFYDDTKRTAEILNYYNGTVFTKTVKKLDQFGNVLAKLETLTDDAKRLMVEIVKQPTDGLVPVEAGAIAALSGMFAREGFKYEYDSRGNWTKRVEYGATEFVIGQDNLDAELKPVRTQVRVINYYD
jgi:hypothetical protein